jgi:hypothetical protein
VPSKKLPAQHKKSTCRDIYNTETAREELSTNMLQIPRLLVIRIRMTGLGQGSHTVVRQCKSEPIMMGTSWFVKSIVMPGKKCEIRAIINHGRYG